MTASRTHAVRTSKRILERQPNFKERKSLVQEVIEAGAVKQWLRENCDCTFQGLQKNLQKALKSVAVRKLEHRMYRCMDAYRNGLSDRDAEFKVRQFGTSMLQTI